MINLNSISPQQAQALCRLKETGNDPLLSLLQDQLDEVKSKLTWVSDDGKIHRLQGRAQAYEDLLRAVEESPKVVKPRN